MSLRSEAAVTFDARHLGARNPRGSAPDDRASADTVPDPDDFILCVGHLVRLGLLAGRPRIDWLSRRLGLSRRSLQRQFEARGTTFAACLVQVRAAEARRQLASTDRPIGQIGLDLGYEDPAHFSRAFQGWAGCPPLAWRRSQRP